jgi:hypothetical protein
VNAPCSWCQCLSVSELLRPHRSGTLWRCWYLCSTVVVFSHIAAVPGCAHGAHAQHMRLSMLCSTHHGCCMAWCVPVHKICAQPAGCCWNLGCCGTAAASRGSVLAPCPTNWQAYCGIPGGGLGGVRLVHLDGKVSWCCEQPCDPACCCCCCCTAHVLKPAPVYWGVFVHDWQRTLRGDLHCEVKIVSAVNLGTHTIPPIAGSLLYVLLLPATSPSC